MLRAMDLLPFLRGIRRFSTLGHPNALDACYVAAWPLPRPDSHRLVNDDFQDHHAGLGGGHRRKDVPFGRGRRLFHYAIVSTILPGAVVFSRKSIAAAASASGKVRFTDTLSLPASTNSATFTSKSARG